jgi:hypothetical protein
MRQGWLAAAFVVIGGLAGCQSVDPADFEPAAAPRPAATPVTLTPAQTDTVKKAIGASLGLRNLKFTEPFVAGMDSAGLLAVCGFVAGKGVHGGPGPKPFVGHFFEDRFVTDKIGGYEARSQDTYSLCTQRGLSLPNLSPPPAAAPPAATAPLPGTG